MKRLSLYIVLMSSIICLSACSGKKHETEKNNIMMEETSQMQETNELESETVTEESENKEDMKETEEKETMENTKETVTTPTEEASNSTPLSGVATMDDGKTTAVVTDDNRGELFFDENGVLFVDGKEYSLTFEDNFDGTELDETKWSNCPEWKRQDQNCYWDNDCTSVSNGLLTVSSKYEDGNYYMGAIRSKGKFSQAKGYFEVRCTLNTVPGYWVAFWLMGETVGNVDGSGIDGTEIDIMESAYFGKGINHALHWDGYGADHKSLGHRTLNESVFDGEFHTFSVLWTDNEYIFYIDRQETWRTEAKEAKGVCRNPLYLKFTAETSSWTSKDRDDSKFPTEVYVDYVKVYEKKN